MEPPVHLKSHFSRGRRYLVAIGFQVFMAEESAEFYPVRGRPKPAIVIDLERLWGEFTQLADDKIEFTIRDVAKVAGVSVRMIRRWQQCGWLPANAPFSTAEAFAAGVVAALVRAGASAISITKASHFLTCGEPQGARR